MDNRAEGATQDDRETSTKDREEETTQDREEEVSKVEVEVMQEKQAEATQDREVEISKMEEEVIKDKGEEATQIGEEEISKKEGEVTQDKEDEATRTREKEISKMEGEAMQDEEENLTAKLVADVEADNSTGDTASGQRQDVQLNPTITGINRPNNVKYEGIRPYYNLFLLELHSYIGQLPESIVPIIINASAFAYITLFLCDTWLYLRVNDETEGQVYFESYNGCFLSHGICQIRKFK